MAKFYQVEKEINGTKYVGQFNGIGAALEAVDNSYIDDSGNTSVMKMAKYILENVIVEPKGLTPDDFESMSEFNEVIAFGRNVMQGNLRPKEDKEPAKGKSGK